MPRLTPQAQAFIKKYPEMSSRKLALLIYGNFEEKYSHVAVNDYQRKLKPSQTPSPVQPAKKDPPKQKLSPSLQTLRKNYPKEKTQKVETNAFPSVKEVVAFTKNISKTKLTFSEFMEKLQLSPSYAARQLREKLNIRGKHRQINLDRILRIIQYVVDVVQE